MHKYFCLACHHPVIVTLFRKKKKRLKVREVVTQDPQKLACVLETDHEHLLIHHQIVLEYIAECQGLLVKQRTWLQQ